MTDWSTEPAVLKRTDSCCLHDTRSKIEPPIALRWFQDNLLSDSTGSQSHLTLNEGSPTASYTPRNQESRSARHCPKSVRCKPPLYEKQDGREMFDPLQLCAGMA